MTKLNGTKTELNLMKAFAGESQARNRYTIFASKAKKEGYEQIAELFLETADQERVHAKSLFKMMEGGEVEITAGFPAGVIGTTAENLTAAAAGENHEHTTMYPEFAEVAKQEGFTRIAALFRAIGKAEVMHETRYMALLNNIEQGKVFEKDAPVKWKCRKCGYVHEGNKAPNVCPTCSHPQGYFEILGEYW